MNRCVLIAVLVVTLGCGKSEEEQARAMREQAQRTAERNGEIAEQKAKLDKLMGDLKVQNDASKAAQARLDSATNDADRDAARAKLATAQAQMKQIQVEIAAVQGGTGAGTRTGTTPRPACTCQAGDPLCSCL
jgi:multidrug resistance efflux pump